MEMSDSEIYISEPRSLYSLYSFSEGIFLKFNGQLKQHPMLFQGLGRLPAKAGSWCHLDRLISYDDFQYVDCPGE